MLFNKEHSIKENLLLNKQPYPLNQTDKNELERIQHLDVINFTEADVRAEIIDPIIKILGYSKNNVNSVDREKHISFLGKKNRYIDYNLTVWEKNFWLIEAKRPLQVDHFGYKELSQATEYSVHPKINASVIVLCDGLLLEIFDRDEDLSAPIISFKIKDLVDNFDNLAKILGPIQIWFFYKRRVLKSIDKAFEAEFNQSRVNEFLQIIENKFLRQRTNILKNLQSLDLPSDEFKNYILICGIDEIIDHHFFTPQPIPIMAAMNTVLVDHYNETNSSVIYKMLPEGYRDANDSYYMNTISFLIQLENKCPPLNYTPVWLTGKNEKNLESMIKGIVAHTLNHFRNDEPRKIILLAANTFRRIYKIILVISPEENLESEMRHLFTRINSSEYSWNQLLSSPTRHILSKMERLSIEATSKFVSSFTTDKYTFNTNLAKQELFNLWKTEKKLLEGAPNYFELLREKDLVESYPTENSGVTYDVLGHNCLCVLKSSPKWKDYILKNHLDEIKFLAGNGSFAAKELMEHIDPSYSQATTSKDLSDRFFFGDSELQSSLSAFYQYS